MTDFLFLSSKITADGDHSQEIRRRLLLDKKAIRNLFNPFLLKSRNITLPTKVLAVKATVFPVVTYGCASGTLKKTEHWRVDAFELWCWRKLLKVLWIARRSNQSILREITLNTHRKDWYWGWCSSTLVVWCEQLTYWKSPWWWERLMAEGGECIREWNDCTASPVQWTWTWGNLGSWLGTGRPGVLQSMVVQRVRHD